jgi:hypothetical protein
MIKTYSLYNDLSSSRLKMSLLFSQLIKILPREIPIISNLMMNALKAFKRLIRKEI